MNKELSKFFKLWKTKISDKRKVWEECIQEDLDEIEYARTVGNMDSVEYCWNCKYSDCDKHP
jgi:hypothetical protein